ncbi:MAG: hypothetical protein ABSH51_28565 [Solirubrobacteraceae bacterium]|jgi:hypothetical protein
MSSFFDELEAQLRGAARAQIAAGRSASRARRARMRIAVAVGRLPVLLTVGSSIAVAVVALVLLRHQRPITPSHPPGGPAPAASGPPAPLHLSSSQRAEVPYIDRAQAAVLRRDPSCLAPSPGVGGPGRRPSLSQGSPSADLLAILGVLRRPARPSDRLPPRIIGAPPNRRLYPNGTIPPLTGVYVRYIRKARHRFGADYYLAPAANANPLSHVPARCFREQETALHQELPQIPAKLRAGVLALETIVVAYQRRRTLPYPGVCLVAINDTGNGDGCSAGYSVSQIQAGRTLTTGAPGGVPVVYGLAPDGVRSVTFHYPGRYPGHPLTVLVIDNVFILHDVRDRLPSDGFPTRLVWRSASGAALETITRP